MKPPGKTDYDIGYGKPPKKSQWKKGQCGRQQSTQPRQVESELEMIDRHLMKRTTLTIGGQKQSMARLEALVLQVSNIEIAGSPAATRLRKRLEKLERRILSTEATVRFEDNDYTRDLASTSEGDK
jgi:hypothetical protein